MLDERIWICGRLWTLDQIIGDDSSFGKVHVAKSGTEIAVIKLIPKVANANRELLFADDLRGIPNVMPVFGTGEADANHALLMPLADKSLRQHLKDSGGKLGEAETFAVIADLALALVGLNKVGIVHRDLKPENVLFYDGHWCIADFGISRYVQAATATKTWKLNTTRPYMAPEQWREETAETPADIYALGVIMYELLRGVLPFPGPDFGHQHLHSDPPTITTNNPVLAVLVEQCLFKEASTRPTPKLVLRRLEKYEASAIVRGGLAALREASYQADIKHARKQAADARQRCIAETEQKRKARLLLTAQQQYDRIVEELLAAISSAVEPRAISKNEVSLASASITMADCISADADILKFPFETKMAPLPFDVIACGGLKVSGRKGSNGYLGRAHSLWFCDAHEKGAYFWYEAAFVNRGRLANKRDARADSYEMGYYGTLATADGIFIPRAAYPCELWVNRTLNGAESNVVVAWPFTLVQVGDLGEFIDRWSTWLADAALGPPPQPSVNPSYLRSWRTENAPLGFPLVDGAASSRTPW